MARGAERVLNRNLLGMDMLLADPGKAPGLFRPGTLDVGTTTAVPVLRAIVDQRLLMRDLLLVDGHGRILAAARESAVRLGAGLPPDLLPAVRAQRVPQLRAGVPVTDPATGERVLHLARALGPSEAGPLIAVATVPVDELAALVAPATSIDALWVTMEDADGVLLASQPPRDALLGRRMPWPAAAGQAFDRVVRDAPGRLEPSPGLAATRPTVYGTIVGTAGLPQAAVLARVAAERRTTWGVAAAFVAAAIGLGALAHVSVVRVSAASDRARTAGQVLTQALASIEEGFLLPGPDDRVVTWNECYLELFPHLRPVMGVGAHIDVLSDVAARTLLPDASPAERQAWIDRRAAHRRRKERAFVFEQHFPDGRTVRTDGRRTADGGMVAIYRDITQERAAAAELERACRAAEAANEAKSRFLATMSHEIRTSLNGVLGMNGLLPETALDPRQRLYAETIRSSGEALRTIINDVLDISRLGAGRMTLEPAPFAPAVLVDEVATLLAPRARDKGIALRVEHEGGVPARLRGEASRIRQILDNLLEQLGHRADVVANGREALQQVRYDLVPMDIQMPEMDGIAATHAIRQLPGALGRIPIVAVSANVLPEQRAAYREAGMADLVTKPIDLARLAEAITVAAPAPAA